MLIFPSTDVSGPPLSPSSKIPPHRAACLQPICPRVHISLLLFLPLCPFFFYLPPPPVASVVTRRLPVRLTCGRCHAATGVLTSFLMLRVYPPQPVRLVGIGSGVGGGASETMPPLMILRSSMRFHHTRKFTTEYYLQHS